MRTETACRMSCLLKRKGDTHTSLKEHPFVCSITLGWDPSEVGGLAAAVSMLKGCVFPARHVSMALGIQPRVG